MVLTIVIPVYDVEKYIGKTLESISKQAANMNDVEVVIVNDGTPDDSMSIVKKYTNLIPNIFVIDQKNGGLSNARNTGLNNARGEYIWFVDSDDWIEDNSIKTIIDQIKQYSNRVDVYCYKIWEYNENGSFICEKFFPFKKTTKLKGNDFLQTRISFAPVQQFVIKRSFLLNNKLSFVDGLIHEDIEFAPRMLLKADNVCIVPETTYCYLRRRGNNITGADSLNEKRLKSLLFILDEYLEMEKAVKSQKERIIIKKIQRISVYAIYNFASKEQIKENYYGAFKGENVRKYKKVICRSFDFFSGDFLHILWGAFFLISPALYKKASTFFMEKIR